MYNMGSLEIPRTKSFVEIIVILYSETFESENP